MNRPITMADSENHEVLVNRLLDWFDKSARNLPWREEYRPYHVWLSEIMLQQTQMERGVDYFRKWIERFPDIEAVAVASEQEILKYWEGLGYYARARNLHKTAAIIMDEYGGKLPTDPEILHALPGIGPYTAAAIASIAGNVDIAVVDANVGRVYARLFDIDSSLKKGKGKRQIESLAGRLLPNGKARLYNQAIMEFGALVCMPRNPKCTECPIAEQCLALKRDTVEFRPLPESRKKTILIEMVTGVLMHDNLFFIQQREEDDIWGGLWEFPGGRLGEGENIKTGIIREYLEETGFEVEIGEKIATVQHVYMHYKVILHGYHCRLAGTGGALQPVLTAARDYRWVELDELQQFGFPAGHRKLIGKLRKEKS